MVQNIKDFGERIQKRRKELQIRQNVLAERINITPNHLSMLENGNSKPSYDVICALCDALDVTPDYLFLGNMHSNNIPKDIADNLRFCSKEDVELTYGFVKLLIERNHH